MPDELRWMRRETIDQFNENRNLSPVFLSNGSSYIFFLKDRQKKKKKKASATTTFGLSVSVKVSKSWVRQATWIA